MGLFHGVYANLNWFTKYLDINKLKGYKIWLAQWDVQKPTSKFNINYWQYTSKGKVNGINENVDLNYCYDNIESIKKSNNEIVEEVIKGLWGNGSERKTRLEKEGYNYNIIQALVNQKLGKKSNEQIANEVIKGLWGNGISRKNKLIKAGYDYNAIQQIVNQKMSK